MDSGSVSLPSSRVFTAVRFAPKKPPHPLRPRVPSGVPSSPGSSSVTSSVTTPSSSFLCDEAASIERSPLSSPSEASSSAVSPGLGGRVLPPTLPLFRPIVRLPAPPPPKPERVSLWDTRGEASCFVERPTSTRPLDSWS